MQTRAQLESGIRRFGYPVPRMALGLILASVLLTLAFVVLTSRRADPGGPRADVEEITVRSREFRFEPDRLRVRAGAVRLTLDNADGEMLHDFTLDTVGSSRVLVRLLGPAVRVAAPSGGRAAVEFTATEGAHLFYCSVYRHRLDGMNGVLVVDESSWPATPPGR